MIDTNKLDPYVGFTFNGKHSSDFGIVRTSSNNRYDNSLMPSSKDITTQVPGMDGQLYWGTMYTKREFQVPFAFYELSEENLAILKNEWDDKQIHDLIFDEQPDRIWSAKMTGQAQIKHLCFEKNDIRYYNGEGTFVFTCYYPFARGEKDEEFGISSPSEDFSNSILKVDYKGNIPANYCLQLKLGEKKKSYKLYINSIEYTITGKKTPGQGEESIIIDLNAGVFYGEKEPFNIFFIDKELPLLSKQVGTFTFSAIRADITSITIKYYEYYK